MKPNQKQNQGFTIIELLVVISIMGIMATLLIVNYNQLSGPRNARIAQNQLSTNLRKAQSYILSARNVATPASSVPASYYLVSLSKDAASYSIQGIDNNHALSTIETINLPRGITISGLSVTSACPSGSPDCTAAQILYASPFGKMYIYSSSDGCGANAVAATQNPSCLLALGDRQATITLKDKNSGALKSVTVYGVSGTVSSSP